MNVKKYYSDKELMATKAIMHTSGVEVKYASEIEECVKDTKIYDTDFSLSPTPKKGSNCIFIRKDSVSAIGDYHLTKHNKVAVLNFASYKNPGGMFIKGSTAQEESLCHESFLYSVLREFNDSYYKWNNKNKNRALYYNRALYSPNVIFARDNKEYKCDVITCAAPNKSAAMRYQSVTKEENFDALLSRIKFVLDVALDNKVDTLILGAFGCGVFGQDATVVCKIFKGFINNEYNGLFKDIIFAIPDEKNSSKFINEYVGDFFYQKQEGDENEKRK